MVTLAISSLDSVPKAPQSLIRQTYTVTETNGGVVTFQGLGATAKGVGNKANADGANLNIFNSVSLKNLVLNGNVNVSAESDDVI